MTETLDIKDMFAQFGLNTDDLLRVAPSTAPVPAAPAHAPRDVRPAYPRGDNAMQQADLARLMSEAQRNVKLQSGLIGLVLQRLRGDEFQRRQYATMLARIDASIAMEEARIAAMVVVSINVLGLQVVSSGLAEMEGYASQFRPDSAAGRAANALLKRAEDDLVTIVSGLNDRATQRAKRSLNLA